MENPLRLNAKERTLLHLHRCRATDDSVEYPPSVTQEGISAATGLLKTHVPRTVKSLEADGLVKSKKGYIRDRGRKVKVYYLSDAGREKASKLEASLFAARVRVKGPDGESERRVEEVLREESRYGVGLDDILLAAQDSDELDLAELRFAKSKERGGKLLLFNVPEPANFIDRAAEREALGAWLGDDAPFMVLTAAPGMGKTALSASFARECGRSVLWFSIPRDRQLEAMRRTASHFFEELLGVAADGGAQTLLEMLAKSSALLVVDGYYEVEEDLVEFMRDLLWLSRSGSGAKVLVASPPNTPSYSRFFTLTDLEGGKVRQLMLKGLDDAGAAEMLGGKVGAEELRKIFLMTKHNPSWLAMIRDGDEKGLLEKTRLTREEIRLLMFWKGK